jgi:murein DD-endopeptidase MepM/ murein hydrolase activator NlpD
MSQFESPVGEQIDRNTGKVWPSGWHDATEYGELYTVKGSTKAYHTGADLNRRRGDDNAPVYAMGDGVVTYARLFSRTAWGNIIIIDHGVVDGRVLYSRYGHVQRIAVQECTKVLKGQKIAGVGNGGPVLNFDPHLHFDISTTSMLKRHPGFWPGLD